MRKLRPVQGSDLPEVPGVISGAGTKAWSPDSSPMLPHSHPNTFIWALPPVCWRGLRKHVARAQHTWETCPEAWGTRASSKIGTSLAFQQHVLYMPRRPEASGLALTRQSNTAAATQPNVHNRAGPAETERPRTSFANQMGLMQS